MATITDIQAEARALVDADSTSLTDAVLLRRVNMAYEDVVSKILGCDGRWQFDDTNYTTFPIATTTLVNSQADYTFDTTHLRILRVEVMDASGNYYQLEPIDIHDLEGIATTEFNKTDGRPVYYDKQGSSIVLYPAPDNGVSVTLALGLKVYFQRTADIFTSAQVTTGTKVPGFASPFHMILAYKAALPYALSYKKDRVAMLMSEIARLEKEMVKFYSKRQKDERQIMTMKSIDNGVSGRGSVGVPTRWSI